MELYYIVGSAVVVLLVIGGMQYSFHRRLVNLKSEVARGSCSVVAHEATGYAQCHHCAHTVARYTVRPDGKVACFNCQRDKGV